MFKIENETDLHCKVVQYIRRFYSKAIIVAVITILDFCLEFKSPTNNYQISEAQKEMKTGKKIMVTTLL